MFFSKPHAIAYAKLAQPATKVELFYQGRCQRGEREREREREL
jgi:hypothetical protein